MGLQRCQVGCEHLLDLTLVVCALCICLRLDAQHMGERRLRVLAHAGHAGRQGLGAFAEGQEAQGDKGGKDDACQRE